MTFDLERARGLRDFLQDDCAEVGDVWGEMIAEIERLQASLIDLHAEYINTLEKNPECSAWDLDEQSIGDQRRLRRNAAHAISIVEPPIYLQADQQAAHIQELEEALVEERANKMIQTDDCTQNQDAADFHHRCICEYNVKKCPIERWWLDRARQALQAEGKIGSDAKSNHGCTFQNLNKSDAIMITGAHGKDHYLAEQKVAFCINNFKQCLRSQCWQITEERKAALWHAIKVLKENDIMEEPEEHLWDEEVTVLQAMLTEAE